MSASMGAAPSTGRRVERQVNEWTLTELAHTLAMPPPTFYQWLCKGYLQLITHRLTVE